MASTTSNKQSGGGGGGGGSNRKGKGGGGGRGGRGGGGGRGKKSKTKQQQTNSSSSSTEPPPPPSAAELAQQEELRLQAELEEARKLKEQEERRLAQAKESEIRAAASLLSTTVATTRHKAALRSVFRIPENLAAKRSAFAKEKKNLKADLKKCTAFVKKIKAGNLYTLPHPTDVQAEVAALNLSRYVEEIIAALIESKPKVADLPNVAALCHAMHERYPEFLPTLLPNLWTTVLQSPAALSSKGKKGPSDIAEHSKLRRFYVRLLTEFLECGLLASPDKLLKCLSEWTGAANNYAVQDAMAIVAFGKQATFESHGKTPMSVRKAIELIENEKANPTITASESVPQLLAEATISIQQLKPMLAESRALPLQTAETVLQHCLGAYETISTSLVQTHTKLQKLEKRCEQDRLLSGQLPAAREKGLTDARKLCDSLLKSVEALSESFDQPAPMLLVEEDDLDAGRGSGVEIWTKETGGQENLGPFDDEETRAFYCDVPDFLTIIPPALLGLSEEDIERRKEENAAKYGSDGPQEQGEPGDESMDVVSEEKLEAVERGEMVEVEDEELKQDESGKSFDSRQHCSHDMVQRKETKTLPTTN